METLTIKTVKFEDKTFTTDGGIIGLVNDKGEGPGAWACGLSSKVFGYKRIDAGYLKFSKYVAISKVNPTSKFGKDLSFLQISKSVVFVEDISNLKVGDVIESRVQAYGSNKYANQWDLKAVVIKIENDELVLEVLK